MLKLITGGAGCGKSTYLMDRIEESIKANSDVLVIIPDQFSFEYDRLLYKRLGIKNFNKITVLSFSRLAREIFLSHGGIKGSYADETVKIVLMRRTLSEVIRNEGLLFYSKQAKSLRFIKSSLEAVKELMLSALSPEQLADGANNAPVSIKEKLSDISVIYSEYMRILNECGYKDGQNDISEAAKKASYHKYFRGKDIYIDEFKSFTADERAIIDVMISDGKSVTVSLAAGETEPPAFSVFDTVNRTAGHLINSAEKHNIKTGRTVLKDGVRFKSGELAFASGNILRNFQGKYDGYCGNIKIYEASDIYNEADFICSEIRRLISEQDYKFSQIAVAVRSKEIYSSVMEGAFLRYGIPFYTDESISIKHKSLVVFIVSALKIASAEKKPSDTETWLRYIKTGFSGLDTEEINIIEDYCYKWNVAPEMWGEPFIDEAAEEIRVRITAPLLKLSNGCKDKTGSEICGAVFEFFDEIKLNSIIESTISGIDDNTAKTELTREYRQLWELLCGLFETLNTVLLNVKIPLSEFSDLFELSAAELKLSSAPQTLDTVLFVSAHTARLASPRAVFVMGANDGELPFSVKTTGLFNERDREALELLGISLSGGFADKISEERFVAYNILSSASEKLYVSYPISDTSGKILYPSAVIRQLINIFSPGIKSSYRDSQLLSFCHTADSAYYQFVQNYSSENTQAASLRRVLMNEPDYYGKIKYLDDLKFNMRHSLDSVTSGKLFGDRMYISPSSFETYRKCPFSYFCKKGLGIESQRRIDISASAQGNVIHYCLYRLFDGIRKESRQIGDYNEYELKSLIDIYMAQFYNSDEIKGDYGKTKRFRETYGKLSDTIYSVAVHLRDELIQSRFTPSEFEYTIKSGGDEAPLKLTACDGTEIYFTGTVDRVDVYHSEENETYIRVVDYKSGTQAFNITNLIYGLNMQMFLYLFALTEKSGMKPYGKYKSALPAGVLHMPVKGIAPKLGREESDIINHINKEYRMNGVLLAENGVINAMEDNVSGIYIPVRQKKDGNYDSNSGEHLLLSNQFEALRKYSSQLIIEMADSIKSGKIEASPLEGKNGSPCDYCDYVNICGREDMKDNARKLYDNKTASEKLAEILGEKEKEVTAGAV